MAFNINEFRATIDKHGGLARNNLFTVEFVRSIDSPQQTNQDPMDNRDLRFFCQSVTFPGIQINTFDYRPNTIDVAQSIPVSIGQQQVEGVFMVDDKYRVMSYFHDWMRRIVNYTQDGISSTRGSGTLYPYEVGYRKEFCQTMLITMYSRHGDLVSSADNSPQIFTYDTKYVCMLYDAYPVHVGGVGLQWGDNDSYTTLPVAFSYSAYDMTSTSSGIETIELPQ